MRVHFATIVFCVLACANSLSADDYSSEFETTPREDNYITAARDLPPGAAPDLREKNLTQMPTDVTPPEVVEKGSPVANPIPIQPAEIVPSVHTVDSSESCSSCAPRRRPGCCFSLTHECAWCALWCQELHRRQCQLPQHMPDIAPPNSSYYFRPYEFTDIPRQQAEYAAWTGDIHNPYDNRFLQSMYETPLARQDLPVAASQMLSVSSRASAKLLELARSNPASMPFESRAPARAMAGPPHVNTAAATSRKPVVQTDFGKQIIDSRSNTKPGPAFASAADKSNTAAFNATTSAAPNKPVVQTDMGKPMTRSSASPSSTPASASPAPSSPETSMTSQPEIDQRSSAQSSPSTSAVQAAAAGGSPSPEQTWLLPSGAIAPEASLSLPPLLPGDAVPARQ